MADETSRRELERQMKLLNEFKRAAGIVIKALADYWNLYPERKLN